MKKKIIWLIALLLLTSLLMVGCQSAEETEAPAGEETGEEAPAEEAPEEMETVTITVWDFGGSEYSWMDEIAIPDFEEKHPNIKVEHVGVIEDELGLKLETAVAAGAPPDLAVFVPARIAAAGHTLPLDDFMARDGLSRDDYCPLMNSPWNVMTGGVLEDQVFALPLENDIWAMAYNKDLFEEAGLPQLGTDDVITYETWLEYSRAINKPADSLEDRVWGTVLFWAPWNSMNNYMSDPFVLGDDGRSCDGNANTPDWMRTWEAMQTAFEEDLTTETAGVLLEDIEEDMFVQGKIGMTYAALGDAIYARDQGLNVGLTGQPVVSEGWEGNVGGWTGSFSIMSATEHPEEAWTFLKYLSTEMPLLTPISTNATASDVPGLPGLPCYKPLLEEEPFVTMIAEDELVKQAAELQERIVPPPFTPDIWTSTAPFYEIHSLVIDEGMTVEEAVNQATVDCQDATDELWDVFDSLGQ